MSSNMTKPAFITFTGVDHADLLPGMHVLSKRFPIEWGVLIDPGQTNRPLYPGQSDRQLIQASALRLSAHICGVAAQSIVEGHDPELDLGGFSRVQINHSRDGSSELAVLNSCAFSARRKLRVALQCQGNFPSDSRVDWLYDVSFGTGKTPSSWPPIISGQPLCGYSGGLGPTTIAQYLPKFSVAQGVPFWIDMESGVRTDGQFDLKKCAAVCELVFGKDAA
jgi:hypothetical protein